MLKNNEIIFMKSNDYIKEFTNINNNKFTKEQTINIFFGTIYHLLNDKAIFKKNIDLKKFLIEVLEKEYKDYLFRSRPYLTSRVLKNFKDEMTYREIIKLAYRIADYLDEKENSNEVSGNKKSKNSSEENIIGWFNQVNKKNED